MQLRSLQRVITWRASLTLVIFVVLMLYVSYPCTKGFAQNAPDRAGIALGRPLTRIAEPINCTTEISYISSNMEEAWLQNVDAWDKDFCNMVQTPQQIAWTKTWLETLQLERQHAGSTAPSVTYDPAVFSRFVTTRTCAGRTTEMVTYIEPLAHGLRHPNALCFTGTDVMDRGYLLIANQAEVHKMRAASSGGSSQPCTNRTCQNIYIDLGGTVWEGAETAGQGWFYTSYQQRGLELDRLLLWEAVAQNPPSRVYERLPKDLMHKYQYFNIPADTDFSQTSHPVNILKTIAQPQDFVVFKLDIDNAGVESAILKTLMDDPVAFALVDEFYFEYHVTFQPMMGYWAGSTDPGKGLADAFKLFYELRKRAGGHIRGCNGPITFKDTTRKATWTTTNGESCIIFKFGQQRQHQMFGQVLNAHVTA